MSKAEELLSRYLYKKEDDKTLWAETLYYLNRKEKLVEGSEWVCEVDNNGDNLVLTRGSKVVVVKTEEHFDYDEVSIHVHVYINGRSEEETIPIDQFLVCFKPLEKRRTNE